MSAPQKCLKGRSSFECRRYKNSYTAHLLQGLIKGTLSVTSFCPSIGRSAKSQPSVERSKVLRSFGVLVYYNISRIYRYIYRLDASISMSLIFIVYLYRISIIYINQILSNHLAFIYMYTQHIYTHISPPLPTWHISVKGRLKI